MLGRIRRCTKRLRTWMGEERAGGDVISGEAHAAVLVQNLPRQLFEVLFPGEGVFTSDKAGALAARLRREAAALERVGGSAGGSAGGASTRRLLSERQQD